MSFIFLRNRVTGGAAFSPASLFSSGEEGAWYEPSTTTAFRSTTNLTPCGYGQSCGFLLDLSKGAGYSGGSFTGTVEQLTNGDFSTGDFTGWSDVGTSNATYAVTAGAAVITRGVGAAGAGIYQDISVSAGDIFVFSVDVEAVTGTAQVAVFGAAAFTPLLSQQNVLQGNTTTITGSIVVTTQTTLRLYLNLQSKPGEGVFDNATFALIPGNHATQGSEPARPILARVPEGGRRNLLEKTEQFDDAYWTKQNATVAANLATAPDGQTTAEKLTPDSGTDVNTPIVFILADQTVETRTLTAYMKAAEYDKGFLRVGGSNALDTSPIAVYDLSAGTVLSSQGTSVVASISSVGDGWYRCRLTYKNGPASAGTGQAFAPNIGCASDTYSVNSSGVLTTTDGTSGIYIWGAQLEAASSASAYQKVVNQYDITEAGVTSLDYLSFDGSDDGMATASIDFTSTDEMSVFAGVRKLTASGAAPVDIICELSASSASNSGAFYLAGPATTVEYASLARGGAAAAVNQRADFDSASADAPINSVVTATHDISGDLSTIRHNGTAGTDATGDKGAGNFGNHPLNIGARDAAGTDSLWFEGSIYGVIIRGASSDATEISNTETYLANRSGVTL